MKAAKKLSRHERYLRKKDSGLIYVGLEPVVDVSISISELVELKLAVAELSDVQ